MHYTSLTIYFFSLMHFFNCNDCVSGNDNLAALTANKRYRLRVDLGDWSGNYRYAEYDNFRVGDASTKYRLTSLGTYTGNAGCFFVCELIACMSGLRFYPT